MELFFSNKGISLEKTLSSLDTFAINFCDVLEQEQIKYVIVSGYVAIAFGRSRN